MDLVRQLEIFVAAGQRGSFSGAARALGISPAAVSAAVATLETHWRARLFERTTRAVVLTETGKALLERGRRVLREVEAAEVVAATASTQVRGTIRVSAPVSYGLRVLAPIFSSFLENNPCVELIVDLSDRRVDLLAEGYDLAVRVGHSIAPGLIARRLAQQRLVLCAAPSYLRANGTPRTPADLSSHRCLLFTPRAPVGRWSFTGPDKSTRTVAVSGPMSSDNGEVLQVTARAGVGITLAPDFLVEDDLRHGALVELMPEWQPLKLGVYTVRVGGGRAAPRIALLIEHLHEQLRRTATDGSPSVPRNSRPR